MTNTLHEAIAAVRAGDTERAQLIAVEVVHENPDDPNGWYLLSQLVDSDARRAAYLSKTLSLDPAHARARMEFESLPPALVQDLAPAAVALPAAGEVAVESPTGEWEGIPAAAPVVEATPPVAGETTAGLPEWLQPLGAQPVASTATAESPPAAAAPAQPQPKPAAARQPAPAKKKKGGDQALSILLGLLALLTILVLVFLVYLLFF